MLSVLRLAARSIAGFLLDGLAIPDHLEPLGSLIMAFTAGTAASTSLHYFLRRNREHRARIDLAIYIVARVVESTPQYRNLLDRPEHLLNILDEQVMPVLNAHLTKGEAKVAMTQLKRKIWDDHEESQERVFKRRRSTAPERSILAESDADIQAQLFAEADEDDDSVMESVEDRSEEQRTPSAQRSTEVQAVDTSRGSPTPRMSSFTSQELCAYTTSSQSQTPLGSSTVVQAAFAPQFAMPPPPSLGKIGASLSTSHRRELESAVSSPNPPNLFYFSGYCLDYNNRTLYPTPTAAANSMIEATPKRKRGRPRKNATQDPSLATPACDPASAVRDSVTVTAGPKRRGRPKKPVQTPEAYALLASSPEQAQSLSDTQQ